MRVGRRLRSRLTVVLFVLAALFSLAGCGGPSFTQFTDELSFGDKQVADEQTTYVMKIPDGELGKLIGTNQLTWIREQQLFDSNAQAQAWLEQYPASQCEALEHTYQEESPDEGEWKWAKTDWGSSCTKVRNLSWLEKTLWSMYEKQSRESISWLSTSRNTLKASGNTVSTLQKNAAPQYDKWDDTVNKYLAIAQGVLVIAAAISLTVLGARILWSISNAGNGGMDGHLLGKVGWIFLGVFMGSSCASIALTFFGRSGTSDGVTTPALQSWTPGGGTRFFVSDWVRMQVDPFLIIAAVCGVLAAGFKLITNQEGRELIPLGKAFMWAILTSVCLAGFIDIFQTTIDSWSANVLKAASSMMNDAWNSNTLQAADFFNLDGPIALLLTIVIWICGVISKIFAYLRAGILPILVGIAPTWAAMSWMETGRQAFGKVMGWLFAFLLYKPVAALVMAAGSAIMVTAGAKDDSQAITLMLTISVIVLLPAMMRIVAPAVASSVGGAGSIMPGVLGGMAGGTVMAAGAGARGMGKLGGALLHAVKSPKGAKPGGGSGSKPAGFGGDAGGTPGGSGRRSGDGAGSDRGSQGGGGLPDGGAPSGASRTPSSPAAPSGAPSGAAADPVAPVSPAGFGGDGGPDGADRSSARKSAGKSGSGMRKEF